MPFGWYAWGPRLTLPWIPGLLLLLLHHFPRQLEEILQPVLKSWVGFVLLVVVCCFFALPHMAVKDSDVLYRFNVANPDWNCPSTARVELEPQRWYQCFNRIIWPREFWIFPQLYTAVLRAPALVHCLSYFLLLLGICWGLRRQALARSSQVDGGLVRT
jgi:hypothetical protein